jgi:hypothetical protein
MFNNFFFDLAQAQYEREEAEKDIGLGHCFVCGWPVREDSEYEYKGENIKHTNCKEEKL